MRAVDKLRELLDAAVAYMSASKDYKGFVETLDRFRPRLEDQYELPFYCKAEECRPWHMKEAAN